MAYTLNSIAAAVLADINADTSVDHETPQPPERPGSRRRRVRLTGSERVLVGLELFLALGALVGGGGMLLDTSGPGHGLSSDLLKGTPFGSFLIPGIVLVILNGLFPVVVAALAILRRPMARFGHIAVALVLAGWLVGETVFIGLSSWMQPFFFAFAIALGALGIHALRTAGGLPAVHADFGPRPSRHP